MKSLPFSSFLILNDTLIIPSGNQGINVSLAFLKVDNKWAGYQINIRWWFIISQIPVFRKFPDFLIFFYSKFQQFYLFSACLGFFNLNFTTALIYLWHLCYTKCLITVQYHRCRSYLDWVNCFELMLSVLCWQYDGCMVKLWNNTIILLCLWHHIYNKYLLDIF